jgi:CheY-like chemotaxis protein
MPDRSFKLTDSGKEVRTSQDSAVPADYRRLLALIGDNTHFNVIRGRLREHPDQLLEDWLAELEEMGFIETVPSAADADLDFTELLGTKPGAPSVPAHDDERLKRKVAEAGSALERSGLFLARERIANRPPAKRDPQHTTVLIVEDDPDQLALADLRVSMAGYPVRIARSAAEFVNEIRTHAPPNIVLLDVMLPDGNGFDILAKIRHHPKLATLPVVMLTAKTEAGDIRRGLELGADAYVTKPYSKSVLVDAIRQVLRVG